MDARMESEILLNISNLLEIAYSNRAKLDELNTQLEAVYVALGLHERKLNELERRPPHV